MVVDSYRHCMSLAGTGCFLPCSNRGVVPPRCTCGRAPGTEKVRVTYHGSGSLQGALLKDSVELESRHALDDYENLCGDCYTQSFFILNSFTTRDEVGHHKHSTLV